MTFFDFQPIGEKKESKKPRVVTFAIPGDPADIAERLQTTQRLINEINEHTRRANSYIDAIPDDLGGDLFCVLDSPDRFFASMGQLIVALSALIFLVPNDEQTDDLIVRVGEALYLIYAYGFWAGTEQKNEGGE